MLAQTGLAKSSPRTLEAKCIHNLHHASRSSQPGPSQHSKSLLQSAHLHVHLTKYANYLGATSWRPVTFIVAAQGLSFPLAARKALRYYRLP